jgi:hypothetical protein
VGVSYYSLLLHTCSNNTRPEDLPLVYDGFDPDTKLYDSGRFKEGKVSEECEVEEESLGDELDTYLARDDKYELDSGDEGAASSEGATDNDEEVMDFKGFSD